MENDLISRSALYSKLCALQSNIGMYDADEVERILKETNAVDAVDEDKALKWLEGYTFADTKQVYTNGTVLVPLFRVRQALKDKAYNGLMEG